MTHPHNIKAWEYLKVAQTNFYTTGEESLAQQLHTVVEANAADFKEFFDESIKNISKRVSRRKTALAKLEKCKLEFSKELARVEKSSRLPLPGGLLVCPREYLHSVLLGGCPAVALPTRISVCLLSA